MDWIGTRRFRMRRALLFVGGSGAAVLLALALDRLAFELLDEPNASNEDWNRMFRVMGYLPLWILLGFALMRCDWPAKPVTQRSPGPRRGLMLICATLLSGVVAEGLKLLIRRERPDAAAEDGIHGFRPFGEEPFSTAGLEMPSSHVAVAFAGCFVLCRFFPRAWPIWLVFAGGCAYTRLLDRAHFLSGVVLAISVAYAAAWFALRALRDRSATMPSGELGL